VPALYCFYLDGNTQFMGSFTMLTVLVLICSLTTTPDLSECRQYTIYVPGQFASPSTCFMRGQAYLAEKPVGELRQDERVKIACVKSKTT
jgi:hypothetical protein